MSGKHLLHYVGAWMLLLALGTTLTTHLANRSLMMEVNDWQGNSDAWLLRQSFIKARRLMRNTQSIGPDMTRQPAPVPTQPSTPQVINISSDYKYDDDDLPKGILTSKPPDYFRAVQRAIDEDNLQARCQRYGFGMTPNDDDNTALPRRIFYGSLIADESWELLEIVAAETYGIFEAMVFVESNRTQSGTARGFRRDVRQVQHMAYLFGMTNPSKVQMRHYVNEDLNIDKLAREHRQRQEILKGWKELGMTPNDIGYIADMDETFTRDFLRAVQTCPYVAALDYESHHCFNRQVKIAGYTRMFEASPECITKDRTWYHPDMILGACIELIGNETLNPPAPRVNDYLRAPGYADDCGVKDAIKYRKSFGKIVGNKFPLWSAADFRRQCGGHNYELNATHHAKYTAFHFHNFFADLMNLRTKYSTYAHAVRGAFRKRLEDMGDDLKMTVRCVQNSTDAPTGERNSYFTETQKWQRVIGGFQAAMPPLPIYFLDGDYRQRKHQAVQEGVAKDERQRQRRMRLKPHQKQAEALKEEAKELRRQAWQKEALARALSL